MGGSLAQFGIAKETTYGTPVAVSKFYEIDKEGVTGKYDRVQADGLSASRFDRADRFVVAPKGAEGDIELEVLSRGFGDWLSFMFGSVTTAAAEDETTVYVHTATPGSMTGRSFTAQVGRPRTDNTIVPWTYDGGKVTKWELSNSVDEMLKVSLSLDFAHESNPASPSGALALQTVSLPSGAEVLSWQGGKITIGGVEVDVTEVSISVDNALKVDRYFIRQNTNKKEQVEDGKRKIEVSFKTDYDNDTLNALVRAANAAGAQTSFEAEWVGLNLAGDTTFPGLKVTIPSLRLDEGAPNVDGPSMLEQSFSAVGLDNGTDPAISVAYTSTDATVLA